MLLIGVDWEKKITVAGICIWLPGCKVLCYFGKGDLSLR